MSVMQIPVTKGKAIIEVNTDDFPDEVAREIWLQGLKVLLNRGTSKVTAGSIPNTAEREAKAIEIANAQLELCKSGKIKFSGGKAKKASGAVMTEARRIAKAMVKDALREQGIKISHVEASEITRLANALLDADPAILAKAEANLAERSKATIAIDVKSMVKESPTLKAKAEAKKKGAGILSATQAGKPRQRPQATA